MRIAGSERYAISKETGLSHDETVERARGLLAAEGYGIVAEIDVQKRLKEALGVDKGPYTILGACNPSLADRAIAAEPELGTLLPCNVIVYETEGHTRVSAVEPQTLLSVVDNEALVPIAKRVREDLGRVVEGLADDRDATSSPQAATPGRATFDPGPSSKSHPQAPRRARLGFLLSQPAASPERINR